MPQLFKLDETHAATDLQRFWSSAFDQFQDAVLLLDKNAKIQRSNVAWHGLVKKQDHQKQSELSQRESFKAWLYQDDIIRFQRVLMYQIPQRLVLRLLVPEQPLIWLSLSLQPLFLDASQNLLIGWCMIASEQTIQIQKQERVDASQRSLNNLLSRVPVMLYRSRNDSNWTMDYVSSGCEKLTGYSGSHFINTPLYGQLIHVDDQKYVWDSIQFALQNHSIFNLQYRLIRADQNIQYVREVGQGLYSQSDMVLGVEGAVFTD